MQKCMYLYSVKSWNGFNIIRTTTRERGNGQPPNVANFPPFIYGVGSLKYENGKGNNHPTDNTPLLGERVRVWLGIDTPPFYVRDLWNGFGNVGTKKNGRNNQTGLVWIGYGLPTTTERTTNNGQPTTHPQQTPFVLGLVLGWLGVRNGERVRDWVRTTTKKGGLSVRKRERVHKSGGTW